MVLNFQDMGQEGPNPYLRLRSGVDFFIPVSLTWDYKMSTYRHTCMHTHHKRGTLLPHTQRQNLQYTCKIYRVQINDKAYTEDAWLYPYPKYAQT